MLKKRLFYLDFVRAIAVFLILLTHFNVPFLPMPNKATNVITINTFGIYIGDLGVSLFFIISGVALTYVYQNKLDLKRYYFKRFKGIYPMFWIAFILATIFNFLKNGHILPNIPKYNIIYSVLGVDNLLSAYGLNTFVVIGEWFLGSIICVYIIFPFILKSILKWPKITLIFILLLEIILFLIYPTKTQSIFFLMRLPEILLGAYFMRYIKRVNLPVFLVSAIIIITSSFYNFQINNLIKTYIIGASVFFVIVYISNYLEYKPIVCATNSISKYSYPIFLVHHFIITQIFNAINVETLSKSEIYVLFIGCLIIIFFISYYLYKFNDAIINYFKRMFLKNKIEG